MHMERGIFGTSNESGQITMTFDIEVFYPDHRHQRVTAFSFAELVGLLKDFYNERTVPVRITIKHGT